MHRKKFLIGVGLVALGLVAAIGAMKLPKKSAVADAKVKGNAVLDGMPKMPNTPEMNKLNEMQAGIAKMSNEDIMKEIDFIKIKAQEMGLVKAGQSANFKLNEHPLAKDMMLRMGLLRVEKAKRDRKQANVESLGAGN